MERLPSTSPQALDERDALSRRKVFRRVVGVAAVGAAGAALAEGIASPARAAVAATTVEPGGVAPAVVALTDAATIALDASQGNDFRVTIGGDRTLETPANPTDGQKIVLQVTQGTSGNFTLSYGSGYEFGAGLSQPTLSTAAGDTDLLAFIYNEAKGLWLFVAYVIGFASTGTSTPTPSSSPTTSLTPTASPSTSSASPPGYRLFPSTSGPSTPVSYSGPFLAGVLFEVTAGGCYFDGYWWWVCPSTQPTAAQTFALWEVYNDGVGTLISSATATSGSLTAGQWNYVPLETPVPLAIGVCYNACTGFSGSFPDTNGQYGSGGPYSAGIVNGPLTAFSDQSGTLPAPFSNSQGVFGVGGTNPTTNMPGEGSDSSNFWMDLQVGTTAPAGSSYRLWPNYPSMQGQADGTTIGYTLATEFKLSETCTLDNIWFYTPPDAAALPTRCGIWSVSSQTEVSGTDNSSPSWTGSAASGWVACAYSGVTLPAGDYKVAVFYGGGSKWFLATNSYWGSGAGLNGITTGPLNAPGLSAATSPGQSSYNQGSWAYPLTYGSGGNGENYWVDVEVTPAT